MGELRSADSVSYPDSLKYYTSKGRVVYGGGGIMPDVFVPIDTVRLSDYFLSLRSAGAFNTFALTWADNHRHDSLYATFDAFMRNYDSLAVAKAFDEYAASKNVSRSDVKGEWVAQWMNDQARALVKDSLNAIHADSYENYLSRLLADEQFVQKLKDKAISEDKRSQIINHHSDIYLGYMIKSLIARNLFGIEYYYRVMRDYDEGLKQAIKTVKAL